jgi:hypothetical protein
MPMHGRHGRMPLSYERKTALLITSDCLHWSCDLQDAPAFAPPARQSIHDVASQTADTRIAAPSWGDGLGRRRGASVQSLSCTGTWSRPAPRHAAVHTQRARDGSAPAPRRLRAGSAPAHASRRAVGRVLMRSCRHVERPSQEKPTVGRSEQVSVGETQGRAGRRATTRPRA